MLVITLELILVLSFIAIPGLSVLRLIQFRYRSSLDLVLAISIAGIAASGLWVYALLVTRLYYSFAPLMIVAVPAGWLIYLYKSTNRIMPEQIVDKELDPAILSGDVGHRNKQPEFSKIKPVSRPQSPPAPPTFGRITALDGVALFSFGLLLLILFLVCFTSPFQSWDAVITWDKWATDWAARTHLYNYSQGGYPQLLPMFSSLLYKTTGHYSVAVPSDQYALHAFHAVLALLLLLATVRAGQLFRLPVWGLVVFIFGFKAVQSVITSGSADLLVTVAFFVTVLLYLGWIDQYWEACFYGTPLLIAGLFAAAFSKAGGVIAILFVFLANVMPRASASDRRLPKRALTASLLVPLVLLVPYYLAQYNASREPIGKHNPHETNFGMPGMLGGLKKIADQTFAGKSVTERLTLASAKVFDEYSAPVSILGTIVGILVVIMTSASYFVAPLRPVLVTAIVLVAIWYRFTSYDLRNLLPAIPLLSVCVSAGGVKIYALLQRYKWTRLIFLNIVGGVAIAIAGRSNLGLFITIQDSFTEGKLTERVSAAEGILPERVRTFFPDDYKMWLFLSRLHLLDRAHNVVAGSPLYRWVPGGIYPFCNWNPQILGPGDLFLSPLPYTPNGNAWTMLQGSEALRVWLWDKDPVGVPLRAISLTGSSPPKLLSLSLNGLQVEAGGQQSLMVYNLPNRDSDSGRSVVWQVSVDADQQDPSLRACSLMYDSSILDPQLSTASIDVLQAGQHILKYSGTLAIKPGSISNKMIDGVLFGLCRTGPLKTTKILDFRYSSYTW